VEAEGAVMEVDIMEDTTADSLAVFVEPPFTMERQDSEPDSSRVTGWMVITIPTQTTVCVKDGFRAGASTPKADKIQLRAYGIRFRCQMAIGKMFPATSPVLWGSITDKNCSANLDPI